jgi:hypothetical protein
MLALVLVSVPTVVLTLVLDRGLVLIPILVLLAFLVPALNLYLDLFVVILISSTTSTRTSY